VYEAHTLTFGTSGLGVSVHETLILFFFISGFLVHEDPIVKPSTVLLSLKISGLQDFRVSVFAVFPSEVLTLTSLSNSRLLNFQPFFFPWAHSTTVANYGRDFGVSTFHVFRSSVHESSQCSLLSFPTPDF
jgi:hypothetical protein